MFGKKKRQNREEKLQATQQQTKTIERKVPVLTLISYIDQGRRKYQQDAVYISTNEKILASNRVTRAMASVCDGMGGMADGGLASATAIEMLAAGFDKIERQSSVNIPNFFMAAIQNIDKKISTLSKENGKGSGTTMVSVIAEDNKLYWASVGDSRIYILRGTQLQQVTRDHNYMMRLTEMVNSGQMTIQEAQAKKQKEALISFLGIGDVSLMDINQTPFEMQFGDIVLLCSDGVTKTLTDEQIKKILLDPTQEMERKAEMLVEAATHRNTHSQDNTSVAILQYRERPLSSRR